MSNPNELQIELFPKQIELYEEVINGDASVIGVGGGRGSGKSSALDRILIGAMLERPIKVCIVMRNYDQIFKYHIEKIKSDFPILEKNIKLSTPCHLKLGKSQMDFSYAESLEDVKRRFMSGNYDIIAVDQSEQFSEDEINEIDRACRSSSGFKAKLILSFNMRGNGLQFHKKWFKLGEVNKDKNPNDYKFFKFNPWDSVVWCLDSLKKDGYTVDDYYNWPDELRMKYASEKGQYTKKLATDDEVIRAADWYGDWTSIEGAYFSAAWDLETTRISNILSESLKRDWASYWLSQDWGRSHYCVTYWNYKVSLSPADIKKHLDWKLTKPINIIVTYRELILSDKESIEVAQYIVDSTPINERSKLRAFYLSPDAFSIKDSVNTIASQQGKIMRNNNMPFPLEADNERKGGYALMGKLLKSTKGKGYIQDINGIPIQQDDIWLISSDCPELLKSIPMLMRDPKDIDDVLKTDKSKSAIEQDCGDAIRYGLKSMLAPRKKNAEDIYNEKMSVASPEDKMMITYRKEMEKLSKKKITYKLPPSWKRN